jgi:hypothetical protein
MSKYEDVTRMFAAIRPKRINPIREADLAALPEPVYRYLHYSQVIGKDPAQVIRLKQEGLMRTQPEKAWMPTVAEQYFTVDPPAFLWYARVNAGPLLSFSGRDEFANGHGHMHIKLYSLVTVMNALGAKIDQGAMVRYLAEIQWFPTAWLSDYLHWEEIDEHRACVFMEYGGMSVSAVLTFGDDGRLQNFEAQRYYGQDNLETWAAPVRVYGQYDGLLIPVEGEVMWRLDTGDFSYFKVRLTDVEYNCPEVY